LPQGHRASSDMKQAQIAANLCGWVELAVARSCEQTGHAPQLVDTAQGTQSRWQWAIDRGDAGELVRVVPGGAERHRTAGAAADQEDSVGVDVKSPLRD